MDDNTLPTLTESVQRQLIRTFGRVRFRIMTDKRFSDLLLHDINQSGLKLAHIADAINCSRASLYLWTSGDSYPNIVNLIALTRHIYGEDMYLDAMVSYIIKIEAERLDSDNPIS